MMTYCRCPVPISIVLAIVLATVLPGAAFGQERESVSLAALEQRAFREAAAFAAPSVVRVETVGGRERIGRVATATGPTTGLVVSEDGYIISSAFNFASRPASVLVRLPDGRVYPATQIATDQLRMLTLLKIDADDLTPVQAVARDEIQVGQWSIALGRTYDPAVPGISVGIVSAVNRVWGLAIQTDAKVSPVNYGGPLIDISGRAMGMLVPLSPDSHSETAGVEWYDSGIGFAIPMQDIYGLLDRLKQGRDLKRGLMGVVLKSRGLYDAEVRIDRVRFDSPAEQAGLREDDRIVEIDGRQTQRLVQVQSALRRRYEGETIALTIDREGDRRTVELTLVGELPPWQAGFLGILPRREPRQGSGRPGVVVRYVFARSPADSAGIATGDRIASVDGVEIEDAAHLTDVVGRFRPGESACIEYERENHVAKRDVRLTLIPKTVPRELPPSVIPPPEGAPVYARGDDDRVEAGNGADSRETEKRETDRFSRTLPGHDREFRVYIPQGYNRAWNHALMVWIHPAGDSMEATLLRRWQSICDLRGMIIVAPRADHPRGWKPSDAPFVRDVMDWIRHRYSVDPGRVFLHAWSDAGDFGWSMVFRNRDLFRGGCLAGTELRFLPPENEPHQRLQCHLMCGEQDPRYAAVRSTVRVLQRAGYPVSFSAAPDRGHGYPDQDDIRKVGRWADCLDQI